MSKYKFGDTFIKENKAYIVLDYKDKIYYLQTRAGTLINRSVDELDDLVERLEYTYYPGFCDPKFIVAGDFHIGDMVVGRKDGVESRFSHKKRVGIVIGKSVRQSAWYDKQRQHYIKIMWSDNGQIEKYNFTKQLFCLFNKYHWDTTFHKFRWKLLPLIK